MKPLAEIEFIAFDVETTSLFNLSGAIVEIGAVLFNGDGRVLGEFKELVDPQTELTEGAFNTHGISAESIKSKPLIGEVMPKFIEFLGSTDRVLLAHNAPFDIGFVGSAMVKSQIEFARHKILDSLPVSRELYPFANSYKLEDLARKFGISAQEVHRALPDSIILKDVFLHLLGQQNKVVTTKDLFAIIQPLSFADADIYAIDPPTGFEDLGAAMENQLPIVMVYAGGSLGLDPRPVTPITIFKQAGRAYLTAHCHTEDTDKTYRLDRIREFQLA